MSRALPLSDQLIEGYAGPVAEAAALLRTQHAEIARLRAAAQQALEVLANARDYLWLPAPGWSAEEQREEICQAIAALHATLVAPR